MFKSCSSFNSPSRIFFSAAYAYRNYNQEIRKRALIPINLFTLFVGWVLSLAKYKPPTTLIDQESKSGKLARSSTNTKLMQVALIRFVLGEFVLLNSISKTSLLNFGKSWASAKTH